MKKTDYKKNTMRYPLLLTLCAVLLLTVESCKKKRSDMAKALYQKTQNKAFKNIKPEDFAPVFEKVMAEEKSGLSNPQTIAAFYEQHENDPTFVMDHLANDDLKTFSAYLQKANEHGLDPKIFKAQEYADLLAKFYNKKAIKTPDEAYRDMAELEIMTANLLINYSNALQFGIVSPRRIYARYYTKTLRPDSVSIRQTLEVKNMKTYLDSIQPKNPQYIALQKVLAAGDTTLGLTKEETGRIIKVNLERLRWKNKPSENKYVVVNIPDFRLDVMEDGKSALNMKVCVGEGRNKNYASTLVKYADSSKVDKPFLKETPQLSSMIYEAQVNPIWNIPQSIVNKELVKHAQDDPYYLDNNNIDVFLKGKKLDDTQEIKWGSEDLSKYAFKQRPGEENSLGKVKFLFPNKSSVYLHDTPVQAPFKQKMRAVSHGCVRLEKPLDLAHSLFGDGSKYEMIKQFMGEENPKPTDVTLPKKIPVYITYITCWADENGALQYRPDVYGLDIVLFAQIQKFLTA